MGILTRLLLTAPLLLLVAADREAGADPQAGDQGIVITIEPDEPATDPDPEPDPDYATGRARRARERAREARERARYRGDTEVHRWGGDHGNVRIEINTDRSGAVVRFGRSLVVNEADVISEAVVIGGNLTVRGQVDQDAVVILGRLKVEDGGQIGGDAVSIGGRLDVAPGGYIDGDRVEMSFFGAPIMISSLGDGWGSRRARITGLVGGFVTLIAILLLGWLAHVLIGRRLVVISNRLRADGLRATLTGFLVFLLWIPAMILCAITLIGIPIAALLGVLLPVAAFVGFLAGCHALGQRVGSGIRFERQGDLGFLLLGIISIGVLSIVGATLNLMGEPLLLVATGFKAAGCVVAGLTSMVGLGALVISRFGRQPQTVAVEAGSAQPPSPEPPAPPVDPTSTQG